MAFIPTLACALATVSYTGPGGAIAQNRIYCATPSVPTDTDLSDIGAVFMTWLLGPWHDLASENWNATALEVRAVNEEEGIVFNQASELPVNGGNPESPPLSNQVSATITLNTGLVGRSARGRIYYVGLLRAEQDGFRLTDTAQSDLQDAFESLRAGLEDDGHAMQVVSFFADGVPRTEGRKLPVVSVNARFPLATQRRRLS